VEIDSKLCESFAGFDDLEAVGFFCWEAEVGEVDKIHV
jgi:hypothetical protein